MTFPSLAIKVDVDTYRGMESGVPALIDIFSRHGIRASFFIAMGPDNSGKAILRFFTRRGFLKKMLHSNAVGMYGLRTALSGTILPARQIARSFPEHFRTLSDRGHEVGIHGHDHVRWHDRLPRLSLAGTREEIMKACEIYRKITGRDPESSAAPGWTCTPFQLSMQDEIPMLYHSDARGTCPFFPVMGGRDFVHLQIPTTLPTLDELLGSGRCRTEDELTGYYLERMAGGSSHVLTIHAEAEGMRWDGWFSGLLEKLRKTNMAFVRLRDVADAALASRSAIPRCELAMDFLPGRAGRIALQVSGRE